MQNQAAVEALYSATFVEDYLDYVENVPDDIQRIHTRLRELDMIQHQDVLSELENLVVQYEKESQDPLAQKRLLNKMMLPLIASQDIGDDKIQLVQTMSDVIENKTRQLDHDSQNLDFGRGDEDDEEEVLKVKVKEEKTDKVGGGGVGGGKRRKIKEEDSHHHGKGDSDGRKAANAGTPTSKKMKKTAAAVAAAAAAAAAVANISAASASGTPVQSGKKKGGGGHVGASSSNNTSSGRGKQAPADRDGSASPPELANVDIDPDEPTYCLCDQISYGEMIGCDNDLCPIEWFHFNCVQLTGKPKGKWFCPKCRGDKPTVMKPKAQFLKELERFNKEKEEKLK